jgi:bifunctional non-homologous end joining protein LigD
MTEDHPLDYATFDGVIPKGEYGGGQVIVWDAGVYAPEIDGRPCFERAAAERHLRRAIEDGKLTIRLHGRKLRGTWTLVRKSGDEWLFLKTDDATADPDRDVLSEDASVLSDLTIDALKAGRRPELRQAPSLLPQPTDEPGARRLEIPSRLPPMLPSLAERPFSHADWLFAPKLDGYRVAAFVQGQRVRLISRGGLDVTDQYPWLARDLARQPFDDAVLDGEIVALDEQGRPSFQLLQNHAGDPSVPLRYFAFDLLHLDGADLRRVPLERRLALLDRRVVPSGGVRVVEHFPEHGVAVYEAALAQGLEGVVAKQRASIYETGRRSRAWLKVKSVLTEDVVVAGYTRGTGARAATFGSLLVGTYADDGRLVYAGHVGTGFDDATLTVLLARLDAIRADASPFDAPLPPRGVGLGRTGGP